MVHSGVRRSLFTGISVRVPSGSLAIRYRRSNLVSCGGAAVVAYRLIWHFDESPETTPPFPVGGVTITDLNLRHFVPLTFYRI